MKKKKNEAFRLKNIKGARIEDAIFYLKEQIEELEAVYDSLSEEKQKNADTKRTILFPPLTKAGRISVSLTAGDSAPRSTDGFIKKS